MAHVLCVGFVLDVQNLKVHGQVAVGAPATMLGSGMCEPPKRLNQIRGLASVTCAEFNESQVTRMADHKRVGT